MTRPLSGSICVCFEKGEPRHVRSSPEGGLGGLLVEGSRWPGSTTSRWVSAVFGAGQSATTPSTKSGHAPLSMRSRITMSANPSTRSSGPSVRRKRALVSRPKARSQRGLGCRRGTLDAQFLRYAGRVGEKQLFDHVPRRDGEPFLKRSSASALRLGSGGPGFHRRLRSLHGVRQGRWSARCQTNCSQVGNLCWHPSSPFGSTKDSSGSELWQ